MTVKGNFEHFQYSNFEKKFLKNEKNFKNLDYRYLVESTKIESTTFSYKTALLRQIKWEIQNGLVTKNGVLPVTALFF